MSAYKKIECDFKDREVLCMALEDLGFKPEIHESPIKLVGYEGNLRNEMAQIVVPRSQIDELYTGASNDLGFIMHPEKKNYIMICSEYDLKSGVGDRIKQSYAKTAINQALLKNKFTVTSENKTKNKITIKAKKII